MDIRICGSCPAVLVKRPGPGRWPKYCSEDCRQRGTRALRVNGQPCPAPGCGKLVPDGWNRIYCSPTCKSSAGHARARQDGRYAARRERQRVTKPWRNRPPRTHPCPHCGQQMSLKRRQCGAPDCAKEYNRTRARAYQRKKSAEYRARGESYTARWRGPEHRATLDALPKDPDKQRARKQENWQRRRAQKRAMPSESFRHVEIYERDGWICGLCKNPVDPALRDPDSRSATLDHIIPLGPAHNGTHTRDNVQLAHRDCNIRKGDRINWAPEEESDEHSATATEPR